MCVIPGAHFLCIESFGKDHKRCILLDTPTSTQPMHHVLSAQRHMHAQPSKTIYYMHIEKRLSTGVCMPTATVVQCNARGLCALERERERESERERGGGGSDYCWCITSCNMSDFQLRTR